MDVEISTQIPQLSADGISVVYVGPVSIDHVEVVVEGNVELGAYAASGKVPDRRDKRGLLLGKTQKLALSGTTIPFWNLLPILKTWIQYICRATPNVHLEQISVVAACARQKFDRRESVDSIFW